jgi:PAS domain-containing protein
MGAACIAVAGLTLFWRVTNKRARERLFAEAVFGSVGASVGFATLLGYAFSLPAVYDWGTNTALSVITAAALLTTGSALLVLAWRESLKDEGGPPAWLPMPAVIGSLTLTLIFWVGLKEREIIYMAQATDSAADQIATYIKSDIDQQTNLVDRLARNGSDNPDTNLVAWQTDAASLFDDAKESGCISIALVDVNGSHLTDRWVYPPKDNVALIGFDHGTDARRREAIEAARDRNGPNVTTSPDMGGKKNLGFVIYAPIGKARQARPLRGGRVPLRTLLRQRLQEGQARLQPDRQGGPQLGLQLAPGRQGRQAVRGRAAIPGHLRQGRSPQRGAEQRPALGPRRATFPRWRWRAASSSRSSSASCCTCGAGASSGQYLSELSNKRLIAENEERRRIEARLKVSDERLRLALDSTQIGILEWNVPKGHVYYSPGLWGLLGYEHARMPSTLEVWQSLINPEDLPVYRKRTESQLNGIASFIDPEYRVRARGRRLALGVRALQVRPRRPERQADPHHRHGPGHHDPPRVRAGAAGEPGRGPQALARGVQDGQHRHHRLRRRQDRVGQQRLLPRDGVHA